MKIKKNNQLRNMIIESNKSVKEVIDKLNKSGNKIIFITKNKKLIGSISDGDLRRSILKKKFLQSNIITIMNKKPFYLFNNLDKKISEKIWKKKITSIPILDAKKNIIRIINKDKFLHTNLNYHTNKSALILAGGLGERLRPLTISTPKPLIKINKKPIIFNIIDSLIYYGYNKIYVSIFYHEEKIIREINKSYKNKIVIVFLKEKKMLGTAGCLSLIKNLESRNLLMINSDILTNLNLRDFENFHLKNKNYLSLCCKYYDIKIPFGVIERKKNSIKIIEKPQFNKLTLSGIYYLNSNIITHLKKNKRIDMPELINKISLKNKKIGLYHPYEIVHDIGTHDQLKIANTIIKSYRQSFKTN
jgi:dTDP-glucose pyrophosphorylase